MKLTADDLTKLRRRAEIAACADPKDRSARMQIQPQLVLALLDRIESIGKILGFSGAANAYHNLGGAIIDIERKQSDSEEGWVYICDRICLKTLKRVEDQLGLVYEVLK